MSYNILQGDIMARAESYDGPPFHALLCDPPYHLSDPRDMRRGYPARDKESGAWTLDETHKRQGGKGFMNTKWDGGDIAFRPETWAALAKHLYPGAFGMAFASSRGWHRMAVAIEDAGLIIHPTIFLWAYGSGFPKATRIDTQVDRAAGAERQRVGTKKHQPKFAAAEMGYREKDNGYNSKERESFDITEPATELAQAWAGHRYGGQALKPAVEPIIVFQKPYEGRSVDCITATGAGALWIDGGRIGSGAKKWETPRGGIAAPDAAASSELTDNPAGRWPANLVLQHHVDCNGTCHPDCAVARLGEQSGEGQSKRSDRGKVEIFDELYKRAPSWHGESTERGHDDHGTAARFFFNADWLLDRLEATDPVGYFAKASSGEREAGLDPMQARLMRDLYGAEDAFDETDQQERGVPADWGRRIGGSGELDRRNFPETTINDGRPTPIDNPYQRGETTRRNIHPTIKPLSLTRWLATLLLPPGAYAPRRLLVPFAGAGSEAIGAMLAGWEDVVGIELEADHVRIAEARIAYWQQMRYKLAPDAPIKAKATRTAPDGQREMF